VMQCVINAHKSGNLPNGKLTVTLNCTVSLVCSETFSKIQLSTYDNLSLSAMQWSSYCYFQKHSLKGASSTQRNNGTSVYQIEEPTLKVADFQFQYLSFHKFSLDTF
jgi:hypothetical protein